jgi:hypothetical protein
MKTLLLIPVILLALLTTNAQNDSLVNRKIYLTLLRIRAEKEKINRLNFNITYPFIVMHCKYTKTDYLNNRLDNAVTNYKDFSIRKIRMGCNAGLGLMEDCLAVNAGEVKITDYPDRRDPDQIQDAYLSDPKDLESAVINGVAAVAASVVMGIFTGNSGGNSTINIPKTFFHKK